VHVCFDLKPSSMFAQTSAIYGLKYQCRTVAARLGDQERHSFLVGTVNPKEDNEVHSIVFDEDSNEIKCQAVYSHPAEVWSLAPCPSHADLFFSTYSTGLEYKASLWRTPSVAPQENKDDESTVHALEEVVELKGHKGKIRNVLWQPHEGDSPSSSSSSSSSKVVSLDEHRLHLWQLEQGASKLSQDNASQSNKVEALMAGAWDPHHESEVVTVNQKAIRAWDLRTMKESMVIENAHEDLIRDIDYNPNKPYHIVTAGDDRRIHLWDMRNAKQPLKVLANHSHWVWSVRYNRFHDQLLLSSSTDAVVNLWSVVSISSAQLGDLEHISEKDSDKLIKSYDEHEDSVYSIAWSSYDAWVFASLSYSGRLVINQVPPAEKYKILL